MYASYIEFQHKPGKTAAVIEMTKQMEADLGQMGMKQFIIVDKGDDSSTLIALYDTAQAYYAAGPKAAELLGRLAVFMAAPPERNQVEVPINFIF
ncbi:MAG TPA: hypothetical protein EYN55_11350 [Rhodospirillales bacterium]|nr:hypothetical protein [Rhodospirillales bacterium]